MSSERFEAWSYRVLVRVCYAEAERRRTRQAAVQTDVTAEPVAADAYGAVIRRDQLERAFAQLTLDQRMVIVLHYLMDLTLDRIAEILEIPQGTVYSRISRGMDALRAAVEADSRPGPSSSITQEAER